MLANLWEILSGNKRMIVHSNEESGIIYTWNGSLTLEVWAVQGHYNNYSLLSAHTFESVPKDYEAARTAAIALEGN
jgi:muconolactone delta-isomerase